MTIRKKKNKTITVKEVKEVMISKGYTDVKVIRGVKTYKNRIIQGYYINSNELSNQFILKSRATKELNKINSLDQDRRTKLSNLNNCSDKGTSSSVAKMYAFNYVLNKSLMYKTESILYTISEYTNKPITDLTFDDINEFRDYVEIFERISHGR